MIQPKAMKRLKLNAEDKAQKQERFNKILSEVEASLKNLVGVDTSEAEEWGIDENEMDGFYPKMTLSVRYYGSWELVDDEYSYEPRLKNKDGVAIDALFSKIKQKYSDVDMYWKASDKSCLYFTVRPIPETE